jgi:hypothetical protein
MDGNEEIQRSLGRLEGKLDSLIAEIKQYFEDDKANFSSIDTGIQKVEKKVYYDFGLIAAIAFIIQHFANVVPLPLCRHKYERSEKLTPRKNKEQNSFRTTCFTPTVSKL